MNFENFVTESNRIEGILRPPLTIEIDGTRMFVEATSPPSLSDVATLALIYAPNKGFLRDQKGMDVRVGSHIAPKGGPADPFKSSRSTFYNRRCRAGRVSYCI